MGRNRWHVIEEEDGALTLARRLPARFDVAAETVLPAGQRPRRLAHRVRQDLWRALSDLRGFAPVVRIVPCAGGVRVRAGGMVEGRFARQQVEADIAGVLEDAGNRARWTGRAR